MGSTASLFVDASPQSPLVASRLPWSLPRTFPSSFPSTVMKFSIVLLAAAATAAIASPIVSLDCGDVRGCSCAGSTWSGLETHPRRVLSSTGSSETEPCSSVTVDALLLALQFGNQPSTTETLVSTEFPRPPPMKRVRRLSPPASLVIVKRVADAAPHLHRALATSLRPLRLSYRLSFLARLLCVFLLHFDQFELMGVPPDGLSGVPPVSTSSRADSDSPTPTLRDSST